MPPVALRSIRTYWREMAAAASVAIGAMTTAIHPPPIGDAAAFVGLAAFFATGVSGLAYVAMTNWSERRHAIGWTIVAAVALFGCFLADRSYESVTDRYVGRYLDRATIVGDEYTPDGAAWVARSGHTSADALLFDAGGVPDRVWTTDGIRRVRTRMRAAYYGFVPLFALAVLATVQAVYCASRRGARPRVRRPTP